MDIRASSSWYRRIGDPVDSTENVVWFPHAGGGTASLVRQCRMNPPPMNLFVAALPGREGRFGEAMPSSLDQLVATLVNELPPFARPPVLVGHSFGALLAYSVAQSRELSGLTVMAMSSPDHISRRESIVNLNNADFAEQLDRRYGGIPQTLRQNVEAMDLFLPIVRHDLALMESYRDEQSKILDIPIIALVGDQDQRASSVKMQGWQSRTSNTFSLEIIAGDHFFPLSQVNRVLQSARRCFDTTR